MMDTLFSVIAGVLIALQSWSLIEVVKLKVSLGEIKEHLNGEIRLQIGRIISDMESEKYTKRRTHSNFEDRIRRLEDSRV